MRQKLPADALRGLGLIAAFAGIRRATCGFVVGERRFTAMPAGACRWGRAGFRHAMKMLDCPPIMDADDARALAAAEGGEGWRELLAEGA